MAKGGRLPFCSSTRSTRSKAASGASSSYRSMSLSARTSPRAAEPTSDADRTPLPTSTPARRARQSRRRSVNSRSVTTAILPASSFQALRIMPQRQEGGGNDFPRAPSGFLGWDVNGALAFFGQSRAWWRRCGAGVTGAGGSGGRALPAGDGVAGCGRRCRCRDGVAGRGRRCWCRDGVAGRGADDAGFVTWEATRGRRWRFSGDGGRRIADDASRGRSGSGDDGCPAVTRTRSGGSPFGPAACRTPQTVVGRMSALDHQPSRGSVFAYVRPAVHTSSRKPQNQLRRPAKTLHFSAEGRMHGFRVVA